MWQGSDSKFYETPLYHIIYSHRISAAQMRGLTTCQHVAEIRGMPLSGQNMGKQVGDMIGAISANEVAHGRPMLSAIVVGVSGVPGDGFYAWAENLGRYNTAQHTRREDFWHQEMEAVYETWKRQFPKA
jgi:hypothetical protein